MKTATVRKALARGLAGLLTVVASGAIYVACSSCCIRAGSLVRTPGGLVPIESIEVGDVVLSWDFRSGQWVENRVETTYRKVGFSWVKAVLPGGQTLEATADHEAYDASYGGYVEVGHVKEFVLAGGAGAPQASAATEQETVYGLATFYDLSLAGEPRNYVANGVVVHNKTISPFSKPDSAGPISGIVTPGGGSGGTNPDIVSPFSGLNGGPISDVITADDFSGGTNPEIVSPYSGSLGGPYGAPGTTPTTPGGGTPPASIGPSAVNPGTPNTNNTAAALTVNLPLPASGIATGGDLIYLSGNGIQAGMTVTVGTVAATFIDVDTNRGTIVFATPAGVAGTPRDIIVGRPDGAQVILPSAFTYLAAGTSRYQFKRGTDKWMIYVDIDADSSGTGDLAEALTAAIGPSGAAGDFTGQIVNATELILRFTHGFYGNDPDGTMAIGGIPISFMANTLQGGSVQALSSAAAIAGSGNVATPGFVGDYNVMIFRTSAGIPSLETTVFGQAIQDPSSPRSNATIENNSGAINGIPASGNELGIFTTLHLNLWNALGVSPSQRSLSEFCEELAATLAHEVGHSIGLTHTDGANAVLSPLTENLMSATAGFDLATVWGFDSATLLAMGGYMPGSNRRTSPLALTPKVLVGSADVVLVGTPQDLRNGKLTCALNNVLQGQVDAPGGTVDVIGFAPSLVVSPEELAPIGPCMFFLQRTPEGYLRLRDAYSAISVAANQAEWEQLVMDYLAIGQLSDVALGETYSERLAVTLTSSSPFLQRTALLELAHSATATRGLSDAELGPVLARIADPAWPTVERILAGQILVHRADPTLSGQLFDAALGTDEPKLLKTLAGALETSLGLARAASLLEDRLTSLSPEQLARARVLFGWLRAADAVGFVQQGLDADAEARDAADALGRIGSEAALPALQAAGSDMSRETGARHCALRAIGRIGGDAARAWLQARWEALPDGDERDAVRFARDYPQTWLVR
jgi:hypothetical protein